MGNPLYFEAADVCEATVTITSEQADSPASRLVRIAPRWERPWRSLTTATQSGTVTFTAPPQFPSGFVVYSANFTSIIIDGVTYPIQADLEGTYKLFKTYGTPQSETDIAFSIPTQATTDGRSYFRLGRLLFFTLLKEVEECPESITREIFDPQITAESELGVFDTLPAGSPYSRESWTGKYTADTLPNIRALFNRRAHQWVGLFRNLSAARDYEFLFYHKDGGTRINYGNVTVDMDVNFRQST